MKFPKDPKLLIAILTVAIVWGTTFLGIRIAVETIPPWFVAGIRQVIAAGLLFIILLFSKQLRWSQFLTGLPASQLCRLLYWLGMMWWVDYSRKIQWLIMM